MLLAVIFFFQETGNFQSHLEICTMKFTHKPQMFWKLKAKSSIIIFSNQMVPAIFFSLFSAKIQKRNPWKFISDLCIIGAIFLCCFKLYMLSFMFRFMFANICFEKNQNSKIHVMFIINITWNETWNNQVLPFASLLCEV